MTALLPRLVHGLWRPRALSRHLLRCRGSTTPVQREERRGLSIYSDPGLYSTFFNNQDRDIEEEVDFLETLLAARTPARCLELGCGPAWHSSLLAQRGHVCTALDSSPLMLEHARSLAEHTKVDSLPVTFVAADMRSIPQPPEANQRYDLVFALFGTFMHILSVEEAERFLQQMHHLLSPTGQLVVQLPHPQALFDGSLLMGSVWEERDPAGAGANDSLVCLEFGSELDELDPETQVINRRLRLLRSRGGEGEESEEDVLGEEVVPQRPYTVPELRWLARAAGLQVSGLYGGFDRCALDADDAHTLLAVFSLPP